MKKRKYNKPGRLAIKSIKPYEIEMVNAVLFVTPIKLNNHIAPNSRTPHPASENGTRATIKINGTIRNISMGLIL